MRNIVKVGGKGVGDNQDCFIIAEIGINHNGDIAIAKKLIDMAVEAGCDAVKFQKRTIDIVYTKEELEKPRESVFGNTNGDLKRGLEFGQKEYDEIDFYCKKNNILWFASCWDLDSVDFIEQYSPPCHKIASACLTDIELLQYIESKNRPVILSTGMSTEEEIERAVNVLKNTELILLHCYSVYPAKDYELNLERINTLRNKYNYPIGYSGHEVGVFPSVFAFTMGACLIERHITLDRSIWGSDQAASLERKGLEMMINNIRSIPDLKGRSGGKILISEAEEAVKKKLRRKG